MKINWKILERLSLFSYACKASFMDKQTNTNVHIYKKKWKRAFHLDDTVETGHGNFIILDGLLYLQTIQTIETPDIDNRDEKQYSKSNIVACSQTSLFYYMLSEDF